MRAALIVLAFVMALVAKSPSSVGVTVEDEALRGWRVFKEGPQLAATVRRCAPHVTGTWSVSVVDGDLVIGREPVNRVHELPEAVYAALDAESRSGVKGVAKVEDGWLVGIDQGEWGGQLAYVRDGGDSQKLIDENVVSLIRQGDEVLVFAGLAHGPFDRAHLYRVRWAHDRPVVRPAGELPGTPLAMADQGGGRVLFVTRSGVWRLLPKDGIERVTGADLRHLGVRSVVELENHTILIGTPLFIGRFRVGALGYAQEWMVRDDCASLAIDTAACPCLEKSEGKQ
jgi:hypothetical protein